MYIAKKPCHFRGETYLIGTPIPEGIIDKSRVSALVKWGMIKEVDGTAPEASAVKSAAAEQNAPQTAQNTPEPIERVETVESATDTEKAVKTAKRGGRKKAEA